MGPNEWNILGRPRRKNIMARNGYGRNWLSVLNGGSSWKANVRRTRKKDQTSLVGIYMASPPASKCFHTSLTQLNILLKL
jgi:hypothetical protein